MLYVSRYGNPILKSREYIAVRISLGAPKWQLGYQIYGELDCLKPFGLLNKFSDYEQFKAAYFERLDRIGFDRIWHDLQAFIRPDRDTVLLCFEDIRKPGEWCHRTAFAEWWLRQTGENVKELPDPTTPKVAAPAQPKNHEQLTMF